ncbi:hypothetical protein PVAP13_6KG019170 [Panicum virgatum]|uniref:Uncharacterized protein n=1 Tax=Panicum virgatum TaxID=38727 RepID=A0A8T0R691_PANVG|nr:hypothetical protein PVAP13_6KG019170 [Panicum virgatum]
MMRNRAPCVVGTGRSGLISSATCIPPCDRSMRARPAGRPSRKLKPGDLFSLSANLNLLFVGSWRHLAPGIWERSKKNLQMQM